MRKVLVEDDNALRAALPQLLAQWGDATEAASTAREARGWLERELFDLSMRDLGLPDGDGGSFRGEPQRRAGHQPLVQMLTARDDRLEKVRGLEEGAGDDVLKPFDPEPPQAWLRSLPRRAHLPLRQELGWGPLQLPASQTSPLVNGSAVELTRKAELPPG